jgi:hypothetical protein
MHKGNATETFLFSTLAFAVFECFGVYFWEIADAVTGIYLIFFHWISLCCLVAGIFAAAHQIIEDKRKRMRLWAWFILPCLFNVLVGYAVWHPIPQYPLPIPPQPIGASQARWLPPELPVGCSNVVVFFGGQGIVYPLSIAEIVDNSKQIPIKDLPKAFTEGMNKIPNYSPRKRDVWVKLTPTYSIGGKSFDYPITPYIESNRLYVEVQLPFSNEKQKVVMDDNFDSELPVPLLWDRNYSTNVIYNYEVVNELTNPVLQIFYIAPNAVVVCGIFQEAGNCVLESFGQTPALFSFTAKLSEIYTNQTNLVNQSVKTVNLDAYKFNEMLTFSRTDSLASVGEMETNELYRPTYSGQRAFFKYPSSLNPGVFADWVTVIRMPFGLYYVNPTNRSQLDLQIEESNSRTVAFFAYGIISAGILWIGFGWFFYQKPFNTKSP